MFDFIFSAKFIAGFLFGGMIGMVGMAILAINRSEMDRWD